MKNRAQNTEPRTQKVEVLIEALPLVYEGRVF